MLRARHILCLCASLLVSPHTLAGGFYLSEVGTPGSLGTAGVANPTNTYSADASWANPAGMTGVEQDEILSGFQLLLPKNEFDSSIAQAGGSDGGNAGEVAAIPSFFYMKKLSERGRFGFSITAPLGGGLDYGDNFVGRYATSKALLQGVGISPSFGYQINDRLSVGAGVSLVYTIYEQEIAINQAPFADGKVKFEDATDWGYQPFLGLTYQLSERALLGVVYRAEADVDLEGDLEFKNLAGPTPPADEVELSWDNPQVLKIGLRYSLSEDTTLFFSVDWEDWSVFSENQLAFVGGPLSPVATLDRDWDDTWHAGVALARRLGDNRGYSLGVSYDSSPVDDDDRTIDLPADEQFKVSAAYAWKGKKKLDFAIGATLLYAGSGKVDQTAQGVRFKGEFDKNYILLLGGTLRYVF